MYIFLHDLFFHTKHCLDEIFPYKTLTETGHFPTAFKSSTILPKTTTPIQPFFVQRQSKIQI